MSQTALEQLEQAKKRVDAVNARRTSIQVRLEAARQQYAEAVAAAQQAHGTSDLDKLRQILIDLEATNTKAVAEFVRAVDEFDAFITKIEEALANPEAMTALLTSMAAAAPAVAPAASAPAAPAPAAQAVTTFDEEEI